MRLCPDMQWKEKKVPYVQQKQEVLPLKVELSPYQQRFGISMNRSCFFTVSQTHLAFCQHCIYMTYDARLSYFLDLRRANSLSKGSLLTCPSFYESIPQTTSLVMYQPNPTKKRDFCRIKGIQCKLMPTADLLFTYSPPFTPSPPNQDLSVYFV